MSYLGVMIDMTDRPNSCLENRKNGNMMWNAVVRCRV